MKVLLLNPPFIDKYSKSSRSPAVTKSGTIYFPLWLSYAAGVLDKEGYELKAYIGEEEVNTITVNDNMNVRLVYTSLNPNNKKKGCGGDISSTTLLIPLIAGASLILLVFLKKKGGKEHE